MAIIALHTASTGLAAQERALDVIANNIANSNTDGFKASRVNFQDLMYIQKAQPGAALDPRDQIDVIDRLDRSDEFRGSHDLLGADAGHRNRRRFGLRRTGCLIVCIVTGGEP